MVNLDLLVLLAVKNLTRIPFLDFLARPGSLTEEAEAGFHTGIEKETADWNIAAHFLPAMLFDERLHDGFQRDAVQGITGVIAVRRSGIGRRLFGFCHAIPGNVGDK